MSLGSCTWGRREESSSMCRGTSRAWNPMGQPLQERRLEVAEQGLQRSGRAAAAAAATIAAESSTHRAARRTSAPRTPCNAGQVAGGESKESVVEEDSRAFRATSVGARRDPWMGDENTAICATTVSPLDECSFLVRLARSLYVVLRASHQVVLRARRGRKVQTSSIRWTRQHLPPPHVQRDEVRTSDST